MGMFNYIAERLLQHFHHKMVFRLVKVIMYVEARFIELNVKLSVHY